jgi:hypothetical protein
MIASEYIPKPDHAKKKQINANFIKVQMNSPFVMLRNLLGK